MKSISLSSGDELFIFLLKSLIIVGSKLWLVSNKNSFIFQILFDQVFLTQKKKQILIHSNLTRLFGYSMLIFLKNIL